MLSISKFDTKLFERSMDCRRDFFRPRSWKFSNFHSSLLAALFSGFLQSLCQILQLRIVTLHHLPNFVTDILWSFRFLIKGVHASLDFLMQHLQSFRRSGVRPHTFFCIASRNARDSYYSLCSSRNTKILLILFFHHLLPSVASSAKHSIIFNI